MVGFVGSHSNALELLEPTEEVFDEMPPFVEFAIERQWSCASWVLRDDDLGPARIETGNDPTPGTSAPGSGCDCLEATDTREDSSAHC